MRIRVNKTLLALLLTVFTVFSASGAIRPSEKSCECCEVAVSFMCGSCSVYAFAAAAPSSGRRFRNRQHSDGQPNEIIEAI